MSFPDKKVLAELPELPARPWETPIVGAVELEAGQWYFGTASDLIEWDANQMKELWRYKVSSVKFVEPLSQNSILVGTSIGVFIFDSDARDYLRNQIPPPWERIHHSDWIRENRIFGRAYAGGGELTNLYVGGSGGLYHRGLGAETFELVSGTEKMLISEIGVDVDGRAWFATLGDGIGCVVGDQVHFLTSDNGLTSDYCNALTIDPHGLWIATDRGLNRIVFDDQIACGFRLSRETVPTGLPSQIIEDIERLGDTLWIATSQGLVSWKPDGRKQRALSPSLYLRKVIVGGKERSLQTNLQLSSGERNLTIEYQGILYAPHRPVRYRYKIEGTDERWRNTEDTRLNFEKLPFGCHEIIIEAGVDGREWSDPIRVAYVLPRPFWQHTWFLVLILVLMMGISWFIVSLRLKAVRRRERMRFRVLESEQKALRAQMNPHFIFNALNSIQELIISEKLENAHFYLSRFGKLMRNILNNSENTFISLEEELEMLQLYLEMEQMRLGGNFEFAIQVGEDVDPGFIQFPTMISQVHAENSVWHGIRYLRKQGKIIVSAKREGKRFQLLIEDNGVGRDFTQHLNKNTRKKIGLRGRQLVEDRLKTINQAFGTEIVQEIIDLKDNFGHATGTRVVISFPYD